MFCPRCGAESDEGSKYCASCGAELPKKAAVDGGDASGRIGFRDRLAGLIGRDRRTRVVTLGTALAIVVAIVGFIALDASDDEDADIPQDAYTQALDSACVQHKKEIAKAQGEALSAGDLDAVSRYAGALVPITGAWRLELKRSGPPVDRTALAAALEAALLEVQIEAGTLARVAREGKAREAAEVAARVDAATANVETAIDGLGLARCGSLLVGQRQTVGQ